MSHSTVTSKGQTTIPGEIRKALQIKPGDKLEYVVEGDVVAQGCARQQEREGTCFCPNPSGRRESRP